MNVNAKTKYIKFRNSTNLEIRDIPKIYNLVLRNLYNFYRKLQFYNDTTTTKKLVSWVISKDKEIKNRKTSVGIFIKDIMLKDFKFFSLGKRNTRSERFLHLFARD